MNVPYPMLSIGGVRDSVATPSMRNPDIIGDEDSQMTLDEIEDEPQDSQDIKADKMIKEKKSTSTKSTASTSTHGKRGGGSHK